MSKTVMRQWEMLRMIPRSPSKISTTDIVSGLVAEGFKVDIRTVQRDLISFSIIYPLISDERDKPYGWSWSKEAAALDIPGMDQHTALAFYLVEQHLSPILPRETVSQLSPHFKAAKKKLDKLQVETGATAWSNKVRVLRQGPDLSIPDVKPDVQREVYTALLLNRRLEVEYKKREASGSKRYQITPLGLVLKNGIFYLPCTINDYDNVVLHALHRFASVKKLDIPAKAPKGFNLDVYIKSGELNFVDGSIIHLKAAVSKSVAFHLGERQLDPKQAITEQSDGTYLLEVSVLETSELRFWLRGYAEQIEVLEPLELRNQLYESAKALVRKYET